MKKLLFIFAFLLIAGCHKKENQEASFNKLPIIKLPIDISSVKDAFVPADTLNLDNFLKKITPAGLEIAGRLDANGEYKTLIFINRSSSYQQPYLYTLSKYGEKIDSLELYKIVCGEKDDYWGVAHAYIGKDLKINLSDTAAIYKKENKNKMVKDSLNTAWDKYIYSIDDEGIIHNILCEGK